MLTIIVIGVVIYVIYRISQPKIDTRLLEACSKRETRDDAFRLIKSNPELVNVSDKYGITPLMIASVAADSPLMKELINHGANVNAVTKQGHTALMLVCMGSTCPSIYQLLVESGSVINARSKEGMTALGYAKRRGLNISLNMYLREQGAVE